MKKYYKEYKSGCPRFEIVTIEDNTMTSENLFIDNKAVWKTWKADILEEFKWETVKDYMSWLIELGYKELKEYKDNLIWINPNTDKSFKQYEFIV
jgi:hypothetical protein